MVTTSATLAVLPQPTITLKKGERLADDHESELLSRFLAIKDQVEALEQERKELGVQLIDSLNEDKVRWVSGSASVVRVKGRESFDLDAFLLAHPELADECGKYKKTSEPYSYVRLGR